MFRATMSSRKRATKILATLGPASSTPERIRDLVDAGANLFRLNYSHGDHADHEARLKAIRDLEARIDSPIGVVADMQGPKLRIGTFADGEVTLDTGDRFRLDLDPASGDATRATLPHPEIFAAINAGDQLLLDDGRIRLSVTACDASSAETEVLVGGVLSDRKGVNVPNAMLPLAALTDKDRRDLQHALSIGADWIALSFIQRPEDIAEARKLVAGRAAILAKIEKPSAVSSLDQIVELADGLMVARGDLGVEVPLQEVPGLQKKIIRAARRAGKPVVVATQMLESMVSTPTPTRAEVSDVATAVYDGADAIMLSAESAVGDYPVEAVTVMSEVAIQVERDPLYAGIMDAEHASPEATAADAITAAARQVAETIGAAAIVTFSKSGSTALRASRERPQVPILALTPITGTARRLTLAWGLHWVRTEDITSFTEMVEHATQTALEQGFALPGQRLVVTAGVPFGTPGATNVLRIAWVRHAG